MSSRSILASSNSPSPSTPAISMCSGWLFRRLLTLSGLDSAMAGIPISARFLSSAFQPILSTATGSVAK